MELTRLVEILLGVKQDYPQLTNDEILRLIELKILMEIKIQLGNK